MTWADYLEIPFLVLWGLWLWALESLRDWFLEQLPQGDEGKSWGLENPCSPVPAEALLPDRDYSCGAAFCDDPACNTHGAKDADDQLLYRRAKSAGGNSHQRRIARRSLARIGVAS